MNKSILLIFCVFYLTVSSIFSQTVIRSKFKPITYEVMVTPLTSTQIQRSQKNKAIGEEPKNNLNRSLSELKQKFTELKFIGTDEKGDQYSDGTPTDGIGVFFYLKNNYVIEEAMVVQSNDGFAKEYFKTISNSFIQAGNYLDSNFTNERNRFIYSYFYIDILNYNPNNINTTLIVYSLK